jgi:hypothetical protein
VRQYLVELYVSKTGSAGLDDAAGRARAAADELTREGMPVTYLRSIFVPEDETSFYLFEGVSVEAVGEASRRAKIPFARVVAAHPITPSDQRSTP